MQLGPPRRAGKTYGRTNKNPLVHDLFGHGSGHENASSTTSLRESPVLPTKDRRSQDTPQNAVTQSENGVSDRKGLHDFPSQAIDKTKALVSGLQSTQDVSLFDIDSSDDGVSVITSKPKPKPKLKPKPKPNKRRRIVRDTSSDTTMSMDHAEPVPLRSRTEQPMSNKLDTEEAIPKHNLARKTYSKKPAAAESHMTSSSNTQTLPQPPAHPRQTKAPPTIVRITKDKSSRSAHAHDDETDVAEHSATDASEYLSDVSRPASVDRVINSGKRKSSPVDAGSEVSSPVRSGFTTLKLGNSTLSSTRLSPDPSSDASSSYRAGRQRLVDRLDAPSERGRSLEDRTPGTSSTSTAVKTQKVSRPRGRLDPGETKKHSNKSLISVPGESDETLSRAALAVKPRTTYATQRSHLSDMIDDIDTFSAPSSQMSKDDVLLRSTLSNIPSQLELEDEDSNDEATGSRLKSIHELRQAGANNRFDREIDALLEDIDTVDPTFKAVRLQALIKLVTKLQDLDFLQHLANSGRIRRLVSMPDRSTDLPTATLLLASFSLLVRSEDVTLEALKQIFQTAIKLAPEMLSDGRSLPKLAKERRQNLSKATINSLIEFEQTLLTSKDKSSLPDLIHPDTVALDCLENCLRRLIQHGDTSATVSVSVYAHILRILSSEVRHLESDDHGSLDLLKLEAALSLLELCSLVVDDADVHVKDKEYEELGNALSAVILKTRASVTSLERNALRVVVSLSNNKPRLCRLLGSTSITETAFNIINEQFPMLARQAEHKTVLDGNKLDSVVLALGCLLNFAECDSTLRERLSKMDMGPSNPVVQLLTIFNSEVSKVDEAMTKEQSQVSVAFGYLSMLLCTLSLHPVIRSQVTHLLKDHSFDKLCIAAEKFFGHLRTLEHISEDDAAMSTFTARFGAILRTIQETGA